MVTLDFSEIAALQKAGAWEALTLAMEAAARQVEAGGADFMLLCTNTMHKVSEAMEAAVSIPMIHIVDPVAAAIKAAGLHKVGLLGTCFTMEDGFYGDRMQQVHGLDVIVPDGPGRAEVHRAIYEELCCGIVLDETRARFREIFHQLSAAGAEGIILGCTELALLVGPPDSPVPLFDSTRLHVEAAVERALA